ncbi:PREDICTED: max-interacting protein 1-like [Branchiostoma belcheri]|uniref:Max-interacting protein 1-like n=1 Tax=Branchiostoma belcheri TaxID=7741 RepID=A0A6P4XG54_BRABE|nr:PREDICTED: max-interacting protein 1-like [Branchiostoma belcheri]
MMGIATLLEAAEFLERREREAEHGYASTLPYPHEIPPRKRTKSSSSSRRSQASSRTTHNELEKNRRAHLRNCLERLKAIIPLSPETPRHTTLGLLNKAKNEIRRLEDENRRNSSSREQLFRQQRQLKRKLEMLHRKIRHDSTGSMSDNRSDSSGKAATPSPCVKWYHPILTSPLVSRLVAQTTTRLRMASGRHCVLLEGVFC